MDLRTDLLAPLLLWSEQLTCNCVSEFVHAPFAVSVLKEVGASVLDAKFLQEL